MLLKGAIASSACFINRRVCLVGFCTVFIMAAQNDDMKPIKPEINENGNVQQSQQQQGGGHGGGQFGRGRGNSNNRFGNRRPPHQQNSVS